MNDKNQSDINSILQREYSLEIGGVIGRGWEILQGNLVGFLLFTLVISLIAVGVVIVAIVFFITIIGIPIGILILILMSPLVLSPLAAGHIIVAFKVIKRQPVEFGDFFNGFKNNYFLPIFLSALVIGLFTTICGVPGQVLSYVYRFSALASQTSEAPAGLLIASLSLSFIGAIAGAIITLFYSLTVPFIVARKMTFWPAMEASRKVIAKQWPLWILLGILLSLINVVGLLFCGLGLLFTSPLTACVIAAAYERIVGLPNSNDSFA
ncbi:hypothetical protein [Altericista sp. CCNU0014]|uniref:hypothetical protein n=1 Tax=Altericista sp. CCNU0014 TaxID=3082949 RepID=UPI00384EDD33